MGFRYVKDDQADGLGVLADFGGEFEHLLKRRAVLQGAFAGPLDHGAVCEGIAERDAEFDDAGARGDGGEHNGTSGREVRIAGCDVGDERRFVFEVKGHERDFVIG